MVRPDKAPPLLMTKPQKLDALARAGVQGAAVVCFTREMSQWEPEEFVRAVLVEWLRVSEVWVGADFLFGRERSGNFTLQLPAAATITRVDGSARSTGNLAVDGRLGTAGALSLLGGGGAARTSAASHGGVTTVVRITISMMAPTSPAAIAPLASATCAKMRPTSPRGTIATPTSSRRPVSASTVMLNFRID